MDEDKKITRKSLLEWLGCSIVISLSSQLLSACIGKDDDASSCFYKQKSGPGITFNPGNGIDTGTCNWKENTVDPQDVASILNTWNLTVDGMVRNPATYSFADILSLARYDQTADFHCVEGWSVIGVPWNGFHLNTLFDIVEPLPGATHVSFHSINNTYKESIRMEDAKNTNTMMAYGINNYTIPLKHGFPLRLVIPYKYAYKSAKYIYRIELTNEPITGFWEQFGYSYEANI